jgi:hypothetical protein
MGELAVLILKQQANCENMYNFEIARTKNDDKIQ